MSEFFDEAKVSIFMTDHALADATGKLNALGMGWQHTALLENGQTPPFVVVAFIDLPGKLAGREFALGVSLVEADSGQVVTAPGPTGQAEAVRVMQRTATPVPQSGQPGVLLPEPTQTRAQVIMGFQQGIPLKADKAYRFYVEIDGQRRKNWYVQFSVLGPPPAPVLGGPSLQDGLTDLPPLDDEGDPE